LTSTTQTDDFADIAKTHPAVVQSASADDFADIAKPHESSSGPDFTANPKGEGLYEMTGKDGNTIQVPYSKVMAASNAGYTVDQKVRERYAKDKNEETMQQRRAHPLGSEPRFAPAADQSTAPKLGEATPKANDLPTSSNPPKAHGAPLSANGALDPGDPERQAGLNIIKRVGKNLLGVADMGPQAYNALKDSLSDDPDISNAGTEALQNLLPHAQILSRVQELKEDWKKHPSLAIENLAGDAIGMFLVGKATEFAPSIVKKTIGKSVKAAGAVAKETFGARPKTATDVVEKTTKANKDAAAEYWDKTHEAVKETGEREDVASAETRGKQMTVDEKHEADLQKVREANNKKRAQHREEVKRIDTEVADAKDTLKKRQQLEQNIKTKTAETFEADEQERVAAKDEENAAWKPWREKAKAFRRPADTIVAAIKKYGVNATELHRLLHDMKENPEDAPEASRYYQDRQWATDQLKLPGHPKYSELSLGDKAGVNDWMERIGVRPPAVSINLDEGASVSLDEVHRAKSVLRRHAGEMRRSGKLIEAGELDQVANVLTDTETDWSREAGVYDELMHAKTATAKYNETFGREIPETKTKIGEAEKTTNPEFLKEQEEEEQLARVAKRNPDLAKSHEKIRAMREELKGMPKEEALTRAIEQEHPEPPSIGDLRGGKHELAQEPKHPGKVPPIEPTPEARPDIPEAVKAGAEDLTEANRKQYENTIDRLRHKGIYIASTGIGLVTSGLLHALVKLNLGDAVTDLFGGATATALSVAGLNKIADLLEKPAAKAWFSAPTEAQLRELEKLPDWQRKELAEGMRKVKVVAQKKGYKISPLITAYMAANRGGANQDEEQK
jgi:hypothetical protein